MASVMGTLCSSLFSTLNSKSTCRALEFRLVSCDSRSLKKVDNA